MIKDVEVEVGFGKLDFERCDCLGETRGAGGFVLLWRIVSTVAPRRPGDGRPEFDAICGSDGFVEDRRVGRFVDGEQDFVQRGGVSLDNCFFLVVFLGEIGSLNHCTNRTSAISQPLQVTPNRLERIEAS